MWYPEDSLPLQKFFIVSFDQIDLNTPLRNAIEDMGYLQATPIQVEAFQPVMSGSDVIGIAQTGTGKTLAYLMPLLKQLKYSEQKHPRILILVPTRELVIQTVSELEKLSKYMTIRYDGVYGGTNIKTQGQRVYNGLDVLVATPGRLIDLTLTGVLRLKSIQKVVIDEVDEMLNLGFRHQLVDIFDMLPPRRQNLMFSATLSEEVEALINDFFYEPLKVQVDEIGSPIEKIKQFVYHVPNFNTKVNLLELFLKDNAEMEKILVFVGNKKLADRLHDTIGTKFPGEITVIHSNKAQNTRINTIKKFEAGVNRVLIATDIAGRGLDFANVTHVINFDTPTIPGDYIHRIGRTGRAEKEGVAITFVNEAELEFQMVIEAFMKKAIDVEPLPENLKISESYTEDERPTLYDKNYLKAPSIKHSKGAFHEKKEKNKKVNSGSPSKKRKKR